MNKTHKLVISLDTPNIVSLYILHKSVFTKADVNTDLLLM